MGFVKKIWKNRQSEYPTRRRLTAVYGQPNVYDVGREEGLVTEEGSAFDQTEMNDLETRVAAGFDETKIFTATFRLGNWYHSGSTWTQTVTCSGMQVAYDTGAPFVLLPGVSKADDDLLRDALNQLAAGRLETLDGQLKATLWAEPPACDIEIHLRRAVI